MNKIKRNTKKRKLINVSSSENDEEIDIKILKSSKQTKNQLIKQDKNNNLVETKKSFNPEKLTTISQAIPKLNNPTSILKNDINHPIIKKENSVIKHEKNDEFIQKQEIKTNINDSSEFNEKIYNNNKNFEKKISFIEPTKDKKYYSFKNIYEHDPKVKQNSLPPKKILNLQMHDFQKIENIQNLKDHFPSIFKENSKILFKLYELIDYNPGISENYKLGNIIKYFPEEQRLQIKLDMDNENIEYLLDNFSQNEENYENFMIIFPINEFVELFIEKILFYSINDLILNVSMDKPNKVKLENMIKDKETKVNIMNVEIKEKGILDKTNDLISINHDSKEIKDLKKKPQSKNIFTNNIHHALRRQIEYYFSNKNYYTDPFIKENLDKENCIY